MLLSNRYVFWGLILLLLMTLIGATQYDFWTYSSQNEKTIIEKSFNNNHSYVVDLNEIDNIKNVDQLNNDSIKDSINYLDKLKNNIFLIIYTLAISFLFLYREKQNRQKILLLEKRDDEIKIIQAKRSAQIYENLSNDLKPFEEYLGVDIRLDTLEEKLYDEPKFLILGSRIVLERLILKTYSCYSSEESNLNSMIIYLYKKRVLNHNIHNYAHIIKAFGNKVAHPNIRIPEQFDSKDATLVLGSLLQLLKEFQSNNLLDDCQNV